MASTEPSTPVTLRDIGAAGGVSHVTVSLALRNNPKIPKATRLRIQKLAAQMGYHPNAMATALAHYKRSSTVTPVQAAIAWLNCWPEPKELRAFAEFERYWRGAFSTAEKFGYRLEEFVCGKTCPLNRLEKILDTRGISGILLAPQPNVDLSDFRWEHFSAVRFGRSVQAPRLHVVASDQVANAMLAVREIRARGYQRIGFITAGASAMRSADLFKTGFIIPRPLPSSRMSRGADLFKAGFLMAQSEFSLHEQLPVLIVDESSFTESQRRLHSWLNEFKPDAILTDLPETRRMLERAGRKVPDDLGLAALSILDGKADAGIDQNAEEIGRLAVLLIVSLLNDHAVGIPSILRQVLVEGFWVDGTSLPRRN